jgi:hypothetical protein
MQTGQTGWKINHDDRKKTEDEVYTVHAHRIDIMLLSESSLYRYT